MNYRELAKATSPQNWYEKEFSPDARKKLIDWDNSTFVDNDGYLVDKGTGKRKERWGQKPNSPLGGEGKFVDPDLLKEYLNKKEMLDERGEKYRIDPFTKERLYLDENGNIKERKLGGISEMRDEHIRKSGSPDDPITIDMSQDDNAITSRGTTVLPDGTKVPPKPRRFMSPDFDDDNWLETYKSYRQSKVDEIFSGTDPDKTSWDDIAKKFKLAPGSEGYKHGKAEWDGKKAQLKTLMGGLEQERQWRVEINNRIKKRKEDEKKSVASLKKEYGTVLKELAKYGEYLQPDGTYGNAIGKEFDKSKSMHVEHLLNRAKEIEETMSGDSEAMPADDGLVASHNQPAQPQAESPAYTQTATNPKTGERVGWNGTAWEPIK